MDIKVSVIIPVYNAEKTLVPCIGNLVHQTLKEIELIFINDCSTDNSLTLLKECELQFPGIVHVFSTLQNLGAGGARNFGLNIAKGEYIGFVDSDDIIDTTMFEKLYHTASLNKYDIVDCGFYYEEQDKNILYTSDEDIGNLNDEKRQHLIAGGGYLWSKLFRKKLIEKHHLRFRENSILEDMDFLMYLFAVSPNIGNIHEVLYIYKNIFNSASKEKEFEKYYVNIESAMISIYQRIHVLSNYNKIKPAVEYSILYLYSCGIGCCLKQLSYNSRDKSVILMNLMRLRGLKLKYVSIDYKKNPYVKIKISLNDCKIMSMNDENPSMLIENFMSKSYV